MTVEKIVFTCIRIATYVLHTFHFHFHLDFNWTLWSPEKGFNIQIHQTKLCAEQTPAFQFSFDFNASRKTFEYSVLRLLYFKKICFVNFLCEFESITFQTLFNRIEFDRSSTVTGGTENAVNERIQFHFVSTLFGPIIWYIFNEPHSFQNNWTRVIWRGHKWEIANATLNEIQATNNGQQWNANERTEKENGTGSRPKAFIALATTISTGRKGGFQVYFWWYYYRKCTNAEAICTHRKHLFK